jgi:hypothetical protein
MLPVVHGVSWLLSKHPFTLGSFDTCMRECPVLAVFCYDFHVKLNCLSLVGEVKLYCIQMRGVDSLKEDEYRWRTEKKLKDEFWGHVCAAVGVP